MWTQFNVCLYIYKHEESSHSGIGLALPCELKNVERLENLVDGSFCSARKVFHLVVFFLIVLIRDKPKLNIKHTYTQILSICLIGLCV